MVRRKQTLRDSPMLWVLLGTALLLWSFIDDNAIVPMDRLQSLDGTVESVSRGSVGVRYPSYYVDLELDVSGGERRQLRQRYGITDFAPHVMELQSGDRVTTLVQENGRGGWPVVWEVMRDGTPVLTYDDTRRFYESRQRWNLWERVIAFVLVVISVLFRLRLGVWRKPARRTAQSNHAAMTNVVPQAAPVAKPRVDLAGWREAHIGFEDDGLKLNGIEIWKQKWRSADTQPVQLPHPAHPQQIHRYDIHEVGDLAHPVRFAACELSNGVWGFFVPADTMLESQGMSADGSLVYENRVEGRNDAALSRAVLIDSTDRRVLVDCAAWASSRITNNADGSLFLHLRQRDYETLFRIEPAARVFNNVGESGPRQALSGLADVVEQVRLATIQNVTPVSRCISPDGSIRVDLVSVEWSNSHWVNSPLVTEIANGKVLLDLWNTDWDAAVSFPGSNRVRLDCRRYQHAGYLAVELDLARRTFQIFFGVGHQEPLPETPLADVASAMEEASLRAAAITPSTPGGHGSLRAATRSRPFAAWRTALLILVAALIAIAAGTYWTMQSAPDTPRKLDVVPTMPK